MFQQTKQRTDPVIRFDNESDGHWLHRVRVQGFYKFRNSITGRRYWLDHWGVRPPDNQLDYEMPPDKGELTNGASGRVLTET